MLGGIQERYETFHKVRYSEPALRSAVLQTDRYMPDRYQPDKAIDVIDEAGAKVKLRRVHDTQNLRQLEEEVRQVVTRMQGVVEKMLSFRLELAGSIFSDRNIARSTRDLKPEVELHPSGLLARAIGQIVRQAGIAT